MIPYAGKQSGPRGGPVPDRSRPGPDPGILRLVMGALAMLVVLAGLSLPAVAAAPARVATPTPNAYVVNHGRHPVRPAARLRVLLAPVRGQPR
ncbi:hypothetical protein GCM10022207_33880 [Streptomyces lannensis]|uniref:Uncharacterized protein n=1 Tax=Streptomyces lannensis TaxID=766498 RepID=A0ABP7K7V7_9ACTN